MKYLQQVLIILSISFVGELLNYYIPFPVPASIYGMLILLVLLLLKIIKVHQIKETGKFLIDIMPILFVPSAVGIMSEADVLLSKWWQIIIIVVVTTIIVMVVSGHITQAIIRRDKKKHQNMENPKELKLINNEKRNNIK